MLAIKTDGGWKTWHLGQNVPQAVDEPVVTFQADGDELNLFISAMMASNGMLAHVEYTKQDGFRPITRNLDE